MIFNSTQHQRFVQTNKKETLKVRPFVKGLHLWPVVTCTKGAARGELFPFDDVIMIYINVFWQLYFVVKADNHVVVPHSRVMIFLSFYSVYVICYWIFSILTKRSWFWCHVTPLTTSISVLHLLCMSSCTLKYFSRTGFLIRLFKYVHIL